MLTGSPWYRIFERHCVQNSESLLLSCDLDHRSRPFRLPCEGAEVCQTLGTVQPKADESYHKDEQMEVEA